jgi:hyperosmotically inducible protein
VALDLQTYGLISPIGSPQWEAAMKLLSASIAMVGAAVYFAMAPVSANTTMAPQSYPAEQAASANEPQAKPAEEHAGQDRDGNVVTDAWISTKIHADFVNEELLEGSDIDVDTKAHVVTLSGTVGSAAGRARAVEIATKTNGVTLVVDRLSVALDARAADSQGYGEQLGREADDVGERVESAAESAGDAIERGAERSGNMITDAWITTKIHADYVNEAVLEGSDIDVDTQSKVVTLTGTVPSQAARARAVEIATKTEGVARVVDKMTINAR